MKAKNFRIGNLVDYGTVVEIVTIHAGGNLKVRSPMVSGTADETGVSKVILIPLTKEWLINFGFQNYHAWEYRWVTGGLQIIESNGYWYPAVFSHPEMSHEDDQCVSLNRIKYVHELQNLFFAITGTELELKTNV